MNIRVMQSKSARSSTSTSQHCGVPEEQTFVCLVLKYAGVARVLAMRPVKAKRVVNEVLILTVVRFDLN